tara:strand:+ start:5057 stop:5320 length:264 start_codon:yes stop_codon:yes gene_type:complete
MLKCITETKIKIKIMYTLETFWLIFKIVWWSSLILIFARSDYYIIKNEMLKSFYPNMSRGCFHVLILLFILPITLPFTLANIFHRWL